MALRLFGGSDDSTPARCSRHSVPATQTLPRALSPFIWAGPPSFRPCRLFGGSDDRPKLSGSDMSAANFKSLPPFHRCRRPSAAAAQALQLGAPNEAGACQRSRGRYPALAFLVNPTDPVPDCQCSRHGMWVGKGEGVGWGGKAFITADTRFDIYHSWPRAPPIALSSSHHRIIASSHHRIIIHTGQASWPEVMLTFWKYAGASSVPKPYQ
jgi:hypothetical protein